MQDVDWTRECAEPIKPSDKHYVLFEWPLSLDERGIPKPQTGKNHWNSNFVRLPCHPESKIQIDDAGEQKWVGRWEVIQQAFATKITSSLELEAAILTYNPHFMGKWKFNALHKMFDDLDDDEAAAFFDNLLPRIIKLALDLPEILRWSIPLLKQTHNCSVSLTQHQISSLLANAFLCTFPRRNGGKEYSTYPEINFSRLFQSVCDSTVQKIICICHYFRSVTNAPRPGVVTFTRRCVEPENLPKWEKLDMELGSVELRVSSTGTIEDSAGMLQADFANKYLGGGVLGYGCVQEEIRFVICPELLVSKLFIESMKSNESVWMIGCERFSSYSGYASNFLWSGAYEETTPFDSSNRRRTCVVAIDALEFSKNSHQFKPALMLRELNKAYIGFYHDLSTPPPPVGKNLKF